ncbi:type II/IV secretion system protein [Candidatus Peregrinibacteria bacterium]|nr:type II/IV secretion system protein [Candidatus Peregrinibacteria bacterium]
MRDIFEPKYPMTEQNQAQSGQMPSAQNGQANAQGAAQVAAEAVAIVAPVQEAALDAAKPEKTTVSIVGSEGATANMSQVNREFQEKSTLKIAKDLGLPYIDIAKTPLNPDYLKILEINAAKTARIIPFFKVGKKLRIAADEPTRKETVEALEKFRADGYEVEVNLASASGMDDAFKIYDQTQQYKKVEIIENVEQKAIKAYEKEIANMADLGQKLGAMTAEEAINIMNVSAMKTNASDIHYEPAEGNVVVRFRIDGILHKVFETKPEIYAKMADQIKYQSKMRLNVVTIPQDGRYVFNYNDKKIAVRVASIPTPYGESFVCRFLPSDRKSVTFEELGFSGLALKKLQNASKIVQGMILVTGPTGSGKSTTLYSVLSEMNKPENKIITLEDPVEYYMRGVTQSQIDEKNGYTFAGGLRSILRQYPDIVMIGEIRDLPVAETASQAALTGHVVLSTLHTNSAIETIPRLINMGLKRFMVAPSLNTIVAQRLVRKVCKSCGTLEAVLESEKKEFEEVFENLKKIHPGMELDLPLQIPKVHGCEKCSNTGYFGRIVIAEVVTVDSEMKRLILDKASSVDLIAAARKEGIITMREDGFLKVKAGLTTLEEVHRVTNFLG